MDRKSFFKKIINNKIMIDILMEFENILDENHFYVYDNWIEGDIVGGPVIKKYTVSILLGYPEDLKPDFEALKRLDVYDIKYKYKKVKKKIFNDNEVDNVNNITGSSVNVKSSKNQNLERSEYTIGIWLIEFIIPRRFFEETGAIISY